MMRTSEPMAREPKADFAAGTGMDPETAWAAVLSRDARFDGRFVYAVRSTGVFCRPNCPSRRPGRAQVSFFDEAQAARAAGFRACRRCHPETQGGLPARSAVERVRAHIDRHLDERAVARACASNRVALLIPCHRVVRGDGSRGGYRWGVGRKQRLLALEKDQQDRAESARGRR